MSEKYQIRSVKLNSKEPVVWELLVKEKIGWFRRIWISTGEYHKTEKEANQAMSRLIVYPIVETSEYYDERGCVNY
jgi:hypothetical protein